MVGIVDEALPGGSEESLKIGDHIKALTTFVRETATPMTVGIQGDWGSGKTSLCLQVQDSLSKPIDEFEQENAYKQIWVNAWEHSLLCSPEESLIKIINQIIDELITADPSKTKAESIKNGVKNVLHGAMRIGGTVALGSAGKEIAESMINNSASSISQLRKDLKTLVKEIRKSETNPISKVVVYVDDLDRIVPENAVQILELLKNIFDIEGCVFILAIDYTVVVQGLETKFGKKNSENEYQFRAFFDKIIQLPFTMPVNDYDLGDYVKDLLRQIKYTPESVELDDDLLEELVVDSIGTNPRAIKRLINNLCLIKILTDQKIKEDVDELLGNEKQATIMFALVCLQVAFPDIYNLLNNYPDFWNWNEAVAARVTHKKETKPPYDDFEEDFKASCEGDNKDFDEEWEKALFRITYINPKERPRVGRISRFMSTILEDVLKSDDYKDNSTKLSELLKLITKGLTQTSVTSVSSSEANSLRPKKGENKRFKEQGIDDWYDRLHDYHDVVVPDWNKEIIQSILDIWKGQPFVAVDSSDPSSKNAQYVIEYASRITLKYNKRVVSEIEVDKKHNVKYSILRTPKHKFAILSINDFDFDFKGSRITDIDRENKSYKGNIGSIEWMRAVITLSNKGAFTSRMVSETLKNASEFRDDDLKDQINGAYVQSQIQAFQNRQRNSQAWQDAADFLEFHYSDKNRKKITLK